MEIRSLARCEGNQQARLRHQQLARLHQSHGREEIGAPDQARGRGTRDEVSHDVGIDEIKTCEIKDAL
jgi:hypothetical protein